MGPIHGEMQSMGKRWMAFVPLYHLLSIRVLQQMPTLPHPPFFRTEAQEAHLLSEAPLTSHPLTSLQERSPYGSEKQELFVKPSPSSGLMSPSLQA